MHFGKKSERPAILVTTESVKSDFVKDSQQYIQYLINEVLRQTGLTTNLVKGMAAFDPLILFKRPMEIALRHFDILYSTFSLRSWVSSANESLCRDQYMQLLDHLRTTYDPDFDISSVSADLIEFRPSWNSSVIVAVCPIYSSCVACALRLSVPRTLMSPSGQFPLLDVITD